MSTGSQRSLAVSLLILATLGGWMTAQADDPGTARITDRRPADAPPAHGLGRSIGATAESQTSILSAHPATPECDGAAAPVPAITTFLNRVMGRSRPEEVRLCAVPPDSDNRDGADK